MTSGHALKRIKHSVRNILLSLRSAYLRRVRHIDIHPTARLSLSAKIDTSFSRGIHIGAGSYVAFRARIMTHDFARGLYLHTRIGKNCFIGGQSLILPGVQIGDGCIIGAGSVVTKDVPAGCTVAGNPARIVRENIKVGEFGRLADADLNEAQLREADPDVARLNASRFQKPKRGPARNQA
ncbi:MAG: acyltransferase [Sphingomonadaceae bacterium]